MGATARCAGQGQRAKGGGRGHVARYQYACAGQHQGIGIGRVDIGAAGLLHPGKGAGRTGIDQPGGKSIVIAGAGEGVGAKVGRALEGSGHVRAGSPHG